MKNVLFNCYQLIQSLENGEKKAISISLSKSNNKSHLLLLFKELDKLVLFNEEKLTKQLKKKGVQNHKILVHRLYKRLLSILFDHTQKHNKELELLANLNHVYTLFHHSLYDNALNLLTKIEKEAKEAALHMIIYQAIDLRKRILIKKEVTPEKIETCIREEKALLYYLDALTHVNKVRIQNHKTYISSVPSHDNFNTQIKHNKGILAPIQKQYIDDLTIKDYLLDIEILEASFLAKINFLSSELNLNYAKKALDLTREKKTLYDTHSNYRNARKRNYINILINLSIRLSKFSPLESLASLKEIIAYVSSDKSLKKHRNFIVNIIETRLLAIFLQHGLEDTFLNDFLAKNSLELATYSPRRQYILLHYRLFSNWARGNINQALSIVKLLHQMKNSPMTIMETIYIKCYEGLLQLELGNYLLLNSIIQQIKYLQQKVTTIEPIFKENLAHIINFIHFIKKIIPIHSKERNKFIKEFIQKNPNYTKWYLCPELKFSTWIDSLLENKTMAVLLLKNYQEHLQQP